jgi:antitoxin component of MazEF toxin-antitoxin module
MVSRVLKRFGNSRCLPLDKTLLEILGIDYENAKVSIMIENNKLIIEKCPDNEDQTQFVLNNEQWKQFNKALETKPKNLSNIKNLLNEPGVFDE